MENAFVSIVLEFRAYGILKAEKPELRKSVILRERSD
jgi:hypothetical protein